MTNRMMTCIAAAGIAGAFAMASTAGNAQEFGAGPYGGPAGPGYGPYGAYGSYTPTWQYHGGPKSDVTRDLYGRTDQNQFGFDASYGAAWGSAPRY